MFGGTILEYVNDDWFKNTILKIKIFSFHSLTWISGRSYEMWNVSLAASLFDVLNASLVQ